jgi:hypothetical protein
MIAKLRSQNRPRNVILIFLLLITLLYVLTWRGNIGVIDEGYMLAVTGNLVEKQTFTINNQYPALVGWGAPKADPSQPIYSHYAPGLSVLAAPLYAVGKLIPIRSEKPLNGLPYLPLIPFFTALLLNTLTTVLTTLAIILTARRFAVSWRKSGFLALLFAVTTFAWPYAKTFYNEPATSMALAWLVYFAVCYRQEAKFSDGLWAGGCLGLAISLRATSLLFIPILLIYLFPRWRGWLAVSPGLALGIILTLAYNYLRYGNIFVSGYEPGFGRAPWEALFGFVISPSRSFFLFNPVALLALPGVWYFFKKWRTEALFLLALIGVQVGVYSAWWAWDGGQALGARFLLPVVPLAILLLIPLLERPRWRLPLVALAVIGFAFQLLCNLANVNDVFYEVIDQQHFTMTDLNWQLAASIPANLWRAYTNHNIDSLVLRALPITNPMLKAGLFIVLALGIVGAVLWWLKDRDDLDSKPGAKAPG